MGGITNNFNFNFNLNLFGQQTVVNSSPASCVSALDLLNRHCGHDQLSRGGSYQRSMPQRGCMPRPAVGRSGPPAGQGLQENEDGSVTTAGGYRIDASGSRSEWKIYGPEGDELTRVWGDPHVDEADGTKWDFTKDSDFVLPDGTRIHADTNYDPEAGNGQSVTENLIITNGADRATISGVNTGCPETTMSQDGYEWRALHVSQNPNQDAFHLAGSGADDVKWVRERNGRIDGVIQDGRGHKVDAGDHQIYDQIVDPNEQACIAPHMRPPVGSRAWGNMVRTQINEAQAKFWGTMLGDFGAFPALNNAYGIHANDINARFETDLREMMYGGWPGYFGSPTQGFDVLSGLIDLLRSDGDWRRQLHSTQYDRHFC